LRGCRDVLAKLNIGSRDGDGFGLVSNVSARVIDLGDEQRTVYLAGHSQLLEPLEAFALKGGINGNACAGGGAHRVEVNVHVASEDDAKVVLALSPTTRVSPSRNSASINLPSVQPNHLVGRNSSLGYILGIIGGQRLGYGCLEESVLCNAAGRVEVKLLGQRLGTDVFRSVSDRHSNGCSNWGVYDDCGWC
jgi:hypothetical protein